MPIIASKISPNPSMTMANIYDIADLKHIPEPITAFDEEELLSQLKSQAMTEKVGNLH